MLLLVLVNLEIIQLSRLSFFGLRNGRRNGSLGGSVSTGNGGAWVNLANLALGSGAGGLWFLYFKGRGGGIGLCEADVFQLFVNLNEQKND